MLRLDNHLIGELFPKGLTMLDLRDLEGEMKLEMSHIAARQEVTQLVTEIKLEVISEKEIEKTTRTEV